ncbi:MAG TPA: tetratricopeptide repeat protein [Bryobacteraceae bacterium]|nr:tetratricopeptide repeat protein [Bryobacteraceae bacterium]
MSSWAPAEQRKDALHQVEARLTQEPDSVDLLFHRACLLAEMGDNEAAKQAYLDVLARCPSHVGALNNLGTLLYITGYRTAARSAYTEAIARHPDHPMAHVNLGNIFLEAGDLAPAREHYEAALALDAGFAEAHQGLGNLLAELGHEEEAARHQRLGLRDQRATELPYRGDSSPIEVLLLVSGRRADVPIRHLLDDKIFRTFVVMPNVYDPGTPLPPHDVVFNAIGDADSCALALDRAVTLMERTWAPVINSPAAVLLTGRASNARRLGEIPGVIAPTVANFSRTALSSPDAAEALAHRGLRFPLLLRSPGFHNGRHFLYVEKAQDLEAALGQLPGEELAAIQYLDARGADGKHRKYRVMMIGGWLYPLHLAISSHWKIHYVTSDMIGDAAYRAEEERFLRDMPAVLGPCAMAALADIQETMGLDYAGIDFGLSPSGDVLLFEANATMTIVPPGKDRRWDYRRAAVERVQDAVRKMISGKARDARDRLASTQTNLRAIDLREMCREDPSVAKTLCREPS